MNYLNLYKIYTGLLEIEDVRQNLKLGDLTVHWMTIGMRYKPTLTCHTRHTHLKYLNGKIAKETQDEITQFLVYLMQEITGDVNITWSLKDTVDMLMVTGNLRGSNKA